ncbi:DNA ligase D [Taibaiella helva]|uniref:DNA ligase D n=1 Tax=Taibaiella helva TaxID=2301235 RepID=UPI000E58EBDD|nr:DNA ligase D [Taibaiella helva]
MSLRTYNQKRSFTETAEPKGLKHKGSSGALHFVIQQHDASHLHYDFRLEMEGVLKSWAVPKGPSLDPEVKRLAMMVEDHPYDYKDFEGIIPEGNYGAGTVIVWDEGTYEPLEEPGSRLKGERLLLKQLKEGSLKFRMQGKKLKGEFALVRTKGMGDNAWLLIKHRDRYASEKDITLKNKSVQSGKTLAKVEATSQKTWISSKKTTASRKAPKKAAAQKTTAKKTAAKKTAAKKAASRKTVKKSKADADADAAAQADITALWEQGTKAPFPKNLQPMLATLVDEPFDGEDWEYEIKWDGYRALALMNNKTAELRSRNNKSFNEKFYPVYDAVAAWGIDAVVDGEIVVVNDKGLASFAGLQNWRSEADGTLLYYVFDLLWLDGRLLTDLPLHERKAILTSLVPEEGLICMGITVRERGKDFFQSAGKLGLEGIIAKRSDSIYLPGERSRDWLKIKTQRRQEVVIGGYTRNDDTPKLFSSLLLGVFDGDQLRYAGKVGTGFNDKLQQEMMRQFKPLMVKKSPFNIIPDYNKPSRFRPNPPHASVTWLKPALVAEINFTEVTDDGVFRHPSFIALRSDKKAKEVVMEKEADTGKTVKKSAAKSAAIVRPPAKGGRKTLLNPSEETQVRRIEGNELKFTHLSKLYWPDDKLSKRDMLNYYYQMAPYILPYLTDRPLSLNRFPNGIKGKSFYQKDVSKSIPGWAHTFPYRTPDEDRDKEFLVGGDETGLLYMANLGTIEMNPWNSRTASPEQPDWCALDIDPDKGNTFEQVIEVARAIHAVLEQLKIKGYCKTSGSTGIHIYIPLGAQYSYDQSQLLAKFVATQVQLQLKEFTSIERMTRNRKGKIYIDYLQNRPQATLAAPYSLRPKPGATVSMPLDWDEVKKGLKMKDFTLKNVPRLIKARGDLFKPVLGKGIDLKKIALPED